MKDIFERLARHLNEGSAKFPETKELLEILEIVFKPEQAEYAINLPLTKMGRIALEDLAKKMGKGIEEVRHTVEAMAKGGTVLASTSRKDGRKYYALWPLFPGMMESIYADGIETEQKRRLSKVWEKYYYDAFLRQPASSNYPLLRIIPINKKIDSASQVLPFEVASNIVQNADIITVVHCLCRSVGKKCNHMLEACFYFGAWADYLIKYKGARNWTKEEALQRLKECEEDGLVHLTGNSQEGNTVICNCCPCCCGALRRVVEFHNPLYLARANFEPRVNQEECILCLKCQEICPTEAITEVPGAEATSSNAKIRVQESQCIGCGLCSAHCPVDAIRIERVRYLLPAQSTSEMTERHLKEKMR